MRRALLLAAAACGLALCACQETAATRPAGLRGAHDIALFGDLMFVTGTDADELRVADLSLKVPDWVKAPNPLHPLSIPVASRPVKLARDVVWSGGQNSAGRYVYSLAANGQEISVVGAAREELKELVRLRPSLGSGSITAIAAASGLSQDANSHLYVAAYGVWSADATSLEGRVFDISLPQQGLTQELADEAVRTMRTVDSASLPCGAILALLPLPDGKLALGGRRNDEVYEKCTDPGASEADRQAQAQTLRAQSAWLVNTLAPSDPATLLDFGAPVRMLVTNPQGSDDHNDWPAASRIYGVLDEESCGQSDRCRGLLAVVGPGGDPSPKGDEPAWTSAECGGSVGAPACDVTRHRMLSIGVDSALIMGADVAANVSIAMREGVVTSERPSALQGILTTSNGRLVFFDGGNLRHLDSDQAAPTATEIRLSRPDGTLLDYISGLERGTPEEGGPTFTDGAVRDEVVVMEYLGNLPGLRGVVVPATSAVLPVPVDPAGVVQVGDEVEVQAAEGCTPPASAAKVQQVTSRPGGGGTLFLDQPLPEGCTVVVRPPLASNQWVVWGTRSGYLGRFVAQGQKMDVTLPTDPADFERAYYRHAPGYDPSRPMMTFKFTDPLPKLLETEKAGATDMTLLRGYRYELVTSSGFSPAQTAVDAAAAGYTSISTAVAGAAAYQADQGKLLVAFPSAQNDAVLQLTVSQIVAGQPIVTFNPLR